MQNETQETTGQEATQAPQEATVQDAVALLTSQHREVEQLFEELKSTSDRAVKKRETLLATITEKLTMHTKLEESIFYPAAKEADESLVLESLEEHANVKAMLRKLGRTEANDETFCAKITVLKEMVQHHVEEEEKELFPKCRQALGEETLAELGEQMQAKMERLEKAH